jgi:integrase
MALTELSVRKAKPSDRQYKLFDEGGLFLLVRPTGGKLWRFKYRYAGKENLISLGPYPETGLKEARERRDEAKKLLFAGKDPSREKKRTAAVRAADAVNSFKAVAEEFIAKTEREGRASATLTKARWFLSLLGSGLTARPVSEIDAPELLKQIKKIEAAGHHETARRLRAFSGRVFRYAIATGRAARNPAADLQGALVSPKVTHRAAIVVADQVGALLRAIDGFEGQPMTKLALQLAAHVFVRPGELRTAEWSEFDFSEKFWRIPASKTKMRKHHDVPLSRQCLTILESAKALTGNGKYVFPSVRTFKRPMSENTLNAALRRLGYAKEEMTAHGFRSTASTLLNESGKWSADVIERALAHNDQDAVRAAYHRGQHWNERVKMAQWWSDHLDTLRAGSKVVRLHVAGS